MKRASLAADVSQLSGVIKAGETLKDKIVGGAKVALAGRRFMDDVAWSFSTVSEGRTEAEASFQKERIDEISREYQGRELPDSIPRILAANPFGPVNNMVGAEGERWLPVHALVPHSDAKSTLDAIEALFDQHEGNNDRVFDRDRLPHHHSEPANHLNRACVLLARRAQRASRTQFRGRSPRAAQPA